MTNWITDRQPTRADGNENGLVLVHHVGLKSSKVFAHWSDLGGAEWRHTSDWTPPTPEPTPAAPEPEPKPETEQWITDRPPTKKDADAVDHVLIRRHPDSPFDWHVYWQYATGAPWRHTDLWWDPFGENSNSNSKSEPPTVCSNCYTSYDSTEPRCPNCGFGFVPEPEPEPEEAVRGFLAFTRVENEYGFTDSAVATDNTAWVRFYGINHPTSDWMAITPLPQPGEE